MFPDHLQESSSVPATYQVEKDADIQLIRKKATQQVEELRILSKQHIQEKDLELADLR